MSTALPNCAKFLYDTLRNDAGIISLVGTRIYEGEPPAEASVGESAVFPCIVSMLHVHSRELGLGRNVTTLELPWYVVKAITVEEDYGTGYAIQRAIMAALQDAAGDVSYAGRTWSIMGTRFGEDVLYLERDSALGRVNHVGLNVRLFACNER